MPEGWVQRSEGNEASFSSRSSLPKGVERRRRGGGRATWTTWNERRRGGTRVRLEEERYNPLSLSLSFLLQFNFSAFPLGKTIPAPVKFAKVRSDRFPPTRIFFSTTTKTTTFLVGGIKKKIIQLFPA